MRRLTRGEVARQRYLQRHLAPGLPDCPAPPGHWRNVLVVPAFRESAALLQRFARLATGEPTLVVLVLNRPDRDPDPGANAPLRAAVHALPTVGLPGVSRLGRNLDLYLLDTEALQGPLPAARGVGLARKLGCDLAWYWIAGGAITDRWICNTDADALLPADYFARLAQAGRAAAAVFPFAHVPGSDPDCNAATALYELRLHHYVLGLEYAGSPYAFHSLGSCIAVSTDAYARVRGFPARSGAEDFHLLNKLAKVGPVARLTGACIDLSARASDRVPFGTGPAVARIAAASRPGELPLFYHPAGFEALRALLVALPDFAAVVAPDVPAALAKRLPPDLAQAGAAVLGEMGIHSALAHCRRHGREPERFLRHFHQWFDARRTLKFLHGVRDRGRPQQTLDQLRQLQPGLWPAPAPARPDALRDAILRHWGWRHDGCRAVADTYDADVIG